MIIYINIFIFFKKSKKIFFKVKNRIKLYIVENDRYDIAD